MTRYTCIGLLVLTFATPGCGGDPTPAKAGNVGDKPDGAVGAGAVKPAVRSSCGDMPILDDHWQDTTAECKSCVDTTCCSEAQACADNADCKSLWECRAKCDGAVSTCYDACTAAFPTPPPEHTAYYNCRTQCAACLDVASCRQRAPVAPPKASYPIKFVCVSYTAGQTVFPDLTVKVCDRPDVECTNPLSTGKTGTDGTVTLDVPSAPAFTSAYVEITGPNVQPTRNYMNYAVGRALFEKGTVNQRLLDSATASALAGVLGAKADPATTALIDVVAVSCANTGLPGMTVTSSSADATTIAGYVVGVAPSPTAKMTDPSGVAAFADHPPGPSTFTVHNAATGETIGTVDAYMRAGFLNGVVVSPLP